MYFYIPLELAIGTTLLNLISDQDLAGFYYGDFLVKTSVVSKEAPNWLYLPGLPWAMWYKMDQNWLCHVAKGSQGA